MIYLDHNSSTHVLQHIRDGVVERQDELSYNPHSFHAAGRAALSHIERARTSIANLIGVKSKNIIFTSGATESNNIAMMSYKASGAAILALTTEHPSVREHADYLVAVDERGSVDLDDLRAKVAMCAWYNDIIFACMYANNETGLISDPNLHALHFCKKYGIRMHVDASQCYGKGGKLSDESVLYASTISLSGHKMHAFKGVGALIFSDDIASTLKPIFLGGHQELGLRPGTMPTEAIFSIGLAAEAVASLNYDELSKKSNYIVNELSDLSILNGDGAPRLANTLNLSFSGVKDNNILIDTLSSKGVMVSGTSACNSGLNAVSYVLEAMYGKDSQRPTSSLRISLATTTSWDDIKAAVKIIRDSVAPT